MDAITTIYEYESFDAKHLEPKEGETNEDVGNHVFQVGQVWKSPEDLGHVFNDLGLKQGFVGRKKGWHVYCNHTNDHERKNHNFVA